LYKSNLEVQLDRIRTINMLELRRDTRRTLDALRRGERFVLTYRGVPVARLEPVAAATEGVPLHDPLFRVDEYAVDGPGGTLLNDEADRLIYGA
jgi:antitoxin (DNA-binding transcriptional repressor) of toxin-antitoxin stability system